jgi:hypothetical protein
MCIVRLTEISSTHCDEQEDHGRDRLFRPGKIFIKRSLKFYVRTPPTEAWFPFGRGIMLGQPLSSNFGNRLQSTVQQLITTRLALDAMQSLFPDDHLDDVPTPRRDVSVAGQNELKQAVREESKAPPKEPLSSDPICSICFVNAISTAFMPCGHATACKSCADTLFSKNSDKCPQCNRTITEVFVGVKKNLYVAGRENSTAQTTK